jgi:hypothetical protein
MKWNCCIERKNNLTKNYTTYIQIANTGKHTWDIIEHSVNQKLQNESIYIKPI